MAWRQSIAARIGTCREASKAALAGEIMIELQRRHEILVALRPASLTCNAVAVASVVVLGETAVASILSLGVCCVRERGTQQILNSKNQAAVATPGDDNEAEDNEGEKNSDVRSKIERDVWCAVLGEEESE